MAANRVTVAEVRDIIDTSLTDAQVQAFIDAAHVTVDNYLLSAGLSSATLKEIEKWLSAHFIAQSDRREFEVEIANARSRFENTSSVGLGLDSSRYGMQVKILDPSGILASAGKPKARFKVISEVDAGKVK